MPPPEIIETDDWIETDRRLNVDDWRKDDSNESGRCYRTEHALSCEGEWRRHEIGRRHVWRSFDVDVTNSPRQLPREVEEFCMQHGLLYYLSLALTAAARTFPTSQPSARLEADPDSDDQWVTIDVLATGDTAEVLDAEDRFTSELTAQVPWPQRDKIRLAYDIA